MSRKSSQASGQSSAEEHPMTDEEAAVLAKRDLERGLKPSTAARHFVHAEYEKAKAGAISLANPRQAVAIGLSKARKAGVPLKPYPGKEGSGGKKKRPARGASQLTKKSKKPQGPKLLDTVSEEPTQPEGSLPARGIRKGGMKKAPRARGAGVAPNVSKLGGKVAGARIRAVKEGKDPEQAVQQAREEVEHEEEESMRKRARKGGAA